MELGLRGKSAIVTGGARSIGKAIVEGLVGEGTNVAIADVLIDMARGVAEQLNSDDVRVFAIKTDVSKKTDVENLTQAALKEFDKIDILVNAAGIIRVTKFLDIEEQEWNQIFDINAKGVYLATRAVAPHMVSRREGKIVNISSRAGKDSVPELSHYGASKFAIIGLTQSIAKELAEYNINVNAICPGNLRNDMWEKISDARSRRTGETEQEIFDKQISTIPLKRMQLPEDIANVALFLCSEVARNITGESINVNGGSLTD